MSPQMLDKNQVPRRSFLKLGAIGLMGLIWPRGISRLQISLADQLGRVIAAKLSLHQQPSFSSPEVGEFTKDSLISISHVTIGDQEPEYNRVWYRIGQDGYVHSGMIQPVQTLLNEPQIVDKGRRLTEVTVPFTDAHFRPGEAYGTAYRLYYETTHWVDKLIEDHAGGFWYRVREDKWDMIYYVQAAHLRIISEDELLPSAPLVPDGAKRIEVNLEKQTVIAYEWERPVFMSRCASGAKFSTGKFSTPSGTHTTYHKRPSRHMAAGNLAANGYDLPGVPWVSYFTERGVAFHGTYWHNDYGRPRSHGCVNMSSQAAKWIYLWTSPSVPPEADRLYEKSGTRVDVFAPDE